MNNELHTNAMPHKLFREVPLRIYYPKFFLRRTRRMRFRIGADDEINPRDSTSWKYRGRARAKGITKKHGTIMIATLEGNPRFMVFNYNAAIKLHCRRRN